MLRPSLRHCALARSETKEIMSTGKEIGDNFCLRIVAGGLDGNPQLWSVLDTVHSAEFIAVHKVFLCRVSCRCVGTVVFGLRWWSLAMLLCVASHSASRLFSS